ncbi:MAG: riboflavin synthase [Sedimentisphaerales bacterium]
MFTGLIEAVCKISSAGVKAGGIRLGVNLGRNVKCGESISVNGVCLTVAGLKGNIAEFDISAETLSKTTLGELRAGSEINTERALKADDRFGGHFVCGHIDAVGIIKKIEKRGDFWQFVFETPKDIQDFLIPKGSIAVDGVSLTIADIKDNNFTIAIIPATYERTIFKNYKPGDLVNIETDIICRAVKKQLDNILPAKTGLTIDKLKEMGF